MLRLRKYLSDSCRWTREDEDHLLRETAAETESASATYLATAPQEPGLIFHYTYAALPLDLERQRDAMLAAMELEPANPGATAS